MTESQILIAAATAVVAYLYIGYRVRKYVQPIRLEIAEAGNRILDNSSTPDSVRRDIEFLLDNIFSRSIAILIVTMFPVVWLFASSDSKKHPVDGLPTEIQREVRDVFRKSVLCIVANSPITFFLFAFEVAIFDILIPFKNGVSRTVSTAQSLNEWANHLRPQH